MKQALSGAVLAILICGLYATAQQPHVTTTLPSATVKLNGASGGGGTGTGFTYDADEGAWIYTPASGNSDTRILSDYIGLWSAAGDAIGGFDSTSGMTSYIAARLAADAIEVRDFKSFTASGTITATNIQCDTSGGAVTGTLDANAGDIGRFVYVTRDGANTCTIGVASGQTLDGVTDGTTTVPSAGWKTFVQTTSTAWVTAGSYPVTGTLSGLTSTYVPVATSGTAIGNSGIRTAQAALAGEPQAGTYIALKTNTTYLGGAAPWDEYRLWTTDAMTHGALRLTLGDGTTQGNMQMARLTSTYLDGQVNHAGYNNDFYSVVESWYGAGYGYHLRSTGFLAIGSGSATAAKDTFWGRASAGVWGAYTDASGTLGGIVAANVTGGHFLGGGSAPTVGGSCGTSPTIAGKDAFIKVTTGSGSPTSCVVTFATAYATAPVCNANASTTTTALNVATTTTTVTVSAAALTAAEVLHISCGSF